MGENAYARLRERLALESRTWLVTGVAGFIGSHLLEVLLQLGQQVVGLDNFATGDRRNLAEVERAVGPARFRDFVFLEGDIRDLEHCRRAMSWETPRGGTPFRVDHVLHQAALGSVPRSLKDPLTTHATNATGFLNILIAGRDAGVRNVIYAASSSTYGDHPGLPKEEGTIGRPLSPYAVTKYVDELYAEVFGRCYGLPTTGLRYFNVFGPRQDPNGAYAAVIPKWIRQLLHGEPVCIHGDGETIRDFCYVANAVQANLLAAVDENGLAAGQVYNVAVGQRTSLNQLFFKLRDELAEKRQAIARATPIHQEFRAGDVRHSLADISKAGSQLGYSPSHAIDDGLAATVEWHLRYAGQV